MTCKVAGGIAWLDDIQQFYRERSVIEKEYSSKLNTLAKKYFEKKAKRSSGLSVGDTPTLTPGSLERYTGSPWHSIAAEWARAYTWQCLLNDLDHPAYYPGITSSRT